MKQLRGFKGLKKWYYKKRISGGTKCTYENKNLKGTLEGTCEYSFIDSRLPTVAKAYTPNERQVFRRSRNWWKIFEDGTRCILNSGNVERKGKYLDREGLC